MRRGHYSDNEMPRFEHEDLDRDFYQYNSHGFRCPEFPTTSLVGKRNVVVLGCSHTFGVGSSDDELWVNMFRQRLDDPKRFRFWNLGQPGASGDLIVRILYATEKLLFPDIVLICWPHASRRERLEAEPRNLVGASEQLKMETDETDHNNFLKNVFMVEKFAEHRRARVFHCFAEETQPLDGANVYSEETLKNCWPAYDRPNAGDADRVLTQEPSRARDGVHYGREHHERFSRNLHKAFRVKFR